MGRVLLAKIPNEPTFADPSFAVQQGYLDQFDLFILSFLRARCCSSEDLPEPILLQFSETAKVEFDRISSELQQLDATRGGVYAQRYENVQEQVGRANQQIVRVAAAVHLACRRVGPIEFDCVHAAWSIVRLLLEDAANLFSNPPKVDKLAMKEWSRKQQSASDVRKLIEIICDVAYKLDKTQVPLCHVRNLFNEHAYNARFLAALSKARLEGFVVQEGTGRSAEVFVDWSRWLPFSFWPPL